MIYTVTLNPSIDYVIRVPRFENGGLNRIQDEAYLAGGKGNNVSVVLKNLGIESTALGFIAGFTGDKIEAMLREKGIRTEFIRLPEGNSRINVKMHSTADGVETEINGIGPHIPQNSLDELLKVLCKLKEGDVLILAGSIPPSVPSTIYEQIGQLLEGKGIRLIVDAEKNLLEKVLKYAPFLVKPNLHELGEMFGVTLHTKEDAVMYARKLQEQGARNVIVSMAGDGAVFLDETGAVYEEDAPKGTVVNSVGSGDSMVAGFLAGMSGALSDFDMTDGERNASAQAVFRLAVCCGSACAFMQGLPQKEDVDRVWKGIS